jgi:ATP-dependent DNA helicase Q1
MADFTWADRLSAFSSCLPCLRTSGAIRLPPDSLSEGSNVAGVEQDTDAFSLHSNHGRRAPGHKRPRNVLRRQPRRAGAMIVALMGRGAAARHGDDEDMGNTEESEYAHMGGSESALDPDAAPLDDAILARLARGSMDVQRFQPRISQIVANSSLSINNTAENFDSTFALSPEDVQAAAAHAKEERRARRAERKALKAAELALTLESARNLDAEFEGFQGSGSATHAGISSPFHNGETASSRPSDGGADEDEDDADADFGAATYTSRRPGDGSSAGRSSDSRSRTSASRSVSTPTSAAFENPTSTAPRPKRSKSGRSSNSSRARSSKTATSASGSSGAPLSPVDNAFVPSVRVEPSDAELVNVASELTADAMEADAAGRFPIAGLGGGARRKPHNAATVLALRGGF